MDYRQKVEFLSKYKKNYYRIKFIDDKITSLKANPVGEDNEYHAPGKTLEEYLDEKSVLQKEMNKVEFIIDCLVKNDTEKYILGYKFMEFMTLEEIAPVIGYSFSQTKRIYKKAINNLKI